MNGFFGAEEDELDDLDDIELISRYEDMVKNNHSIYLSMDDYECLFIHYARFYYLFSLPEEINFEMAGHVIRDGLAQYPDAGGLKLFAIYYKFMTENLTVEKAVKLLKKIEIQDIEKNMQTYYLATIYAKINAVPEAVALYQKLLEQVQTEDEEINIYSDLIFLFNKQEDVPKMYEYYEKVRDFDAIRERFLFKDLYFHFLFKPELGMHFFELYVKQYPFSAKGWLSLGGMYAVLMQYEKTVEVLHNAVALSSDDTDYLISLAGAYNAWGKKEKALEYYHEVLSIDAEHTDCYLYIADLYYSLEQPELALKYYGMALDDMPDDIEALMGTAIVLASMKKYEEALSYLNKIRKRNIVPVEALLLISDYLIELERDDEAITLFEQMTELHPFVADVWLSYSNYYVSYENYAQAYSILRCGMFAMKDKEDSVLLLYRMANYYFLEGQNDRAISFLETAYLIDPTCLYIFLEYDEDITKNPLIMDFVNGLKENK
jgi:tetratricopeptide (TPR) repeat protein